MVTASKIYNKMLLFRIRPHLEPILRINQNGFRPGRSTLSQILALRRLIEGIKAKQLTAAITFVDFKKAFDSIHRILISGGWPRRLTQWSFHSLTLSTGLSAFNVPLLLVFLTDISFTVSQATLDCLHSIAFSISSTFFSIYFSWAFTQHSSNRERPDTRRTKESYF